MARFLFTGWPFAGHLHPNIAVAHALKAHGHEVAFYTGLKAADKIQSEGFRYFPFREVDEGKVDRLVFSQMGIPSFVKRPFGMIALYRGWLLDTVPAQLNDLQAVMKQWPPHVLVCDPTFWGPILVLHDSQPVPVAISSFIPGCLIPGPDAPPWGLGLRPPRNWHTRLFARMVETTSEIVLTDFRHAVNQLRKRYGLPPIADSVNAFTAQMPLYLIPSVPELDYDRKDLPSSVKYVGPCVWNKSCREGPPEWLARVPRNQPWIHVTEGTMHSQEPFVLRSAAQGLGELPVQVIMTTGGDRDPSQLDLGSIAPNVRVERWVPHSDLLPLTDVMVTTGGASTILAGLSAGVPMVIVPTQWDKPDNAQRVVEAGAGLRLSPRRCTPKRLRVAVERLLVEPSFRQSAQRLAGILASYGGANKAADLLNKLCG